MKARLSLAAAVLALACATDGGGNEAAAPESGPVPWTGLPVEAAPGDFHFVVVSDRTGGERPGIFDEALEKVNWLQPDFVVSVGDLIEGYTEDRDRVVEEWDELDGFLDALDMPFFYAAGNHDFSNEMMSELWRERLGPSFYHFRHRDALFLVLNSELFASVPLGGVPVPGPDTQEAQLAYAKAALAANADARWTFVIIHQPLWDASTIHPDWLRVEEWLGDRPYTVFAGHHHRYTATRRHDRRYLTLASTGGFSRMRGVDHGEFDHVMWVTLTEDGPVFANLTLDGIHSADARTEETRRLARQLEGAIEAEPLRSADARFERGTARFRLRNPTEGPLEIVAELRAGRDLVPAFPEARQTLAPGTESHLDVPVAARAPVAVGAAAPALVEWTLRAPKADGSRTKLRETSWIVPERVFGCGPAPGAVAIDGDLGEWSELPHTIAARPLPENAPRGASLRFATAYDSEGLVLAGAVVDPTPLSSAERIARDQDAVALTLDARPAAEREVDEPFGRARKSGSFAQMLSLWITPGSPRPDPLVGRVLPAVPDSVEQAVRRSEGGYTFELRIPHAWLDARAGGAWDGFRLDLALQDFAAEGRASVTQRWRPSRFGLDATTRIPGAGRFERR